MQGDLKMIIITVLYVNGMFLAYVCYEKSRSNN